MLTSGITPPGAIAVPPVQEMAISPVCSVKPSPRNSGVTAVLLTQVNGTPTCALASPVNRPSTVENADEPERISHRFPSPSSRTARRLYHTRRLTYTPFESIF